MTMKQKQVNNEIDQSSSHDEQDLASFNDTERLTGKNPTPHERADLIVRRLENFIRKGRTEDGGINFRKWQEMAVLEVANAIRDAEKYLSSDQIFFTRILSVGAASLLTIGIWGTVLAADAATDRQTAALILIIAGSVLVSVLAIWGIRRIDHYFKRGRREYHIQRVLNFDRQLAKLDKDLEKRLKKLQDTIKEMTKGNLKKL